MTSHAYTEKELVEEATMQVLGSLGWTTISAARETFGESGTLRRGSNRDIVLTGRLREARRRAPRIARFGAA